MAMAAPVETTVAEPPLTAIPEDQDQPQWRSGQNKRGPASKRFGHQEATEQERQAFMERTASLSTDDWQRTLIYLYQWAPSVDLTRGGRDPKYRKIYTRHMSEEDIKRDIGSGTYELKLNQINPKGQEKTIDRIVISIMDYDFPPNIPPGPWLDDPKNADWLWAKPLLEAKYKTGASQQNGTASSGPSWSEMIQFMREERRPDQQGPNAKDQLMGSIVTILPALLQQQNNASDPAKMIEALVKAKEIIAPTPATPPAQDNTLMTFLLAQLTRLQESNDKLIMLILTDKREATKQPGPLDQMKQMTEIMSTVSQFITPPAAREPWQEVVTELGPKVLGLGENIVSAIAMQNRMRPVQTNPAQPVQTNNPPQVIPVQAQPANPQRQPAADPATQLTEPAPGGPELDTMQRTLLLQVAGLTSNALLLGLSGDQFAEQVCTSIFNDKIYETFIGSISKEQLLPAFRSIPEAWQVLAPFEPQLPSFIEAFYAYAEGEPEEPLIPEVVKGKPKGKKK